MNTWRSFQTLYFLNRKKKKKNKNTGVNTVFHNPKKCLLTFGKKKMRFRSKHRKKFKLDYFQITFLGNEQNL